jgi:hypothetical protein
VAGVAAEQRAEAVEVAVAVVVPDVGALAAGDDRDLVLVVVAPHSREVHPEVLAGDLLQAGAGIALRVDVLRGCDSHFPHSPSELTRRFAQR